MSCRLLELPAELRNAIYELAFSPGPRERNDPPGLEEDESGSDDSEEGGGPDNGESQTPDSAQDEESKDEGCKDEVSKAEEFKTEGSKDEESKAEESKDEEEAEEEEEEEEAGIFVDSKTRDPGSPKNPHNSTKDKTNEPLDDDDDDDDITDPSNEIAIPDQHGPQPSLLSTCTQIKAEAQAAYNDALKLFQRKKYHYHITLTSNIVDKTTSRLQDLVEHHAGPTNLPRAQSLRLHFELKDWDFDLQFQVAGNGFATVSSQTIQEFFEG